MFLWLNTFVYFMSIHLQNMYKRLLYIPQSGVSRFVEHPHGGSCCAVSPSSGDRRMCVVHLKYSQFTNSYNVSLSFAPCELSNAFWLLREVDFICIHDVDWSVNTILVIKRARWLVNSKKLSLNLLQVWYSRKYITM